MQIHKSDPAFIAKINKMERLSWRDIMDIVKQRAIDRQGVADERKVFGQVLTFD